jgi:hypothetical protein
MFLLGVNYWPRRHNIKMWKEWNPDDIREDLDTLRGLGVRALRFFILAEDFFDPHGRASEESMAKLRHFMDLLAERGLLGYPTLIVGHMSGRNWAIPYVFESRMRRLVELYEEFSGGTHGFIDFPLPWRSVQLASVAVRMLDTSVQLAFAADPSLGVLVPLVHPSSAASVPLAPPAGIAALSPPLRPGGTKPPIVLRPAEVGGKRGLFVPGRLHINRFHVDVGGPALGGAEPNALRGPGAPGHIAGSLRRSSAQRFVHAT